MQRYLSYIMAVIWCKMRRWKPEPTLLPTQEIVNLPHHIGIVREELAFDGAISYTQWGEWIAAELNVMSVTGFRIRTAVTRVTDRCLNQLSWSSLVFSEASVMWLIFFSVFLTPHHTVRFRHVIQGEVAVSRSGSASCLSWSQECGEMRTAVLRHLGNSSLVTGEISSTSHDICIIYSIQYLGKYI